MSDKMREAFESDFDENMLTKLSDGSYYDSEIEESWCSFRYGWEAALTQQPESEPVAFAKDGNLFWHGDPTEKRGVNCDLFASPQPSAQVPEDLLPRVKNLLLSLGHQGEQLNPDEPPYDVGEWGIREAQELYTQLSAAPSIAEKREPEVQ